MGKETIGCGLSRCKSSRPLEHVEYAQSNPTHHPHIRHVEDPSAKSSDAKVHEIHDTTVVERAIEEVSRSTA